MTAIQAIWPGFAKQFDKVVPDEFWNWDDGAAVIACPCGASPTVEQNQTAICEGRCGRVFMLIGERIQVATYDPADLFPDEEPVPAQPSKD